MKIVIGVDESLCAQAAIEFVKAVEWPHGTQVELVCPCRRAAAGRR